MSESPHLALRDSLRQQMPVAERHAYLDHAAVAPLPQPTRKAITRWLDQAAEHGDVYWPEWAKQIEQTRQSAAELISASPAEIALVPSTTHGITLVAEGLDWQSGDNVVTLADEFPSNLYPWMHQRDRGVEVRTVETDNGRVVLDRLREAVDHRTRVLSVSWVGYKTGYRQPIDDIAQIAHGAGALFFLDAIQGLGVAPLDVTQTPVDCLAADGHKWLLGPEGAGVAYIRHAWLDRLRPLGVGWNSVEGRHDFNTIDLKLRDEAARYEGGSANMVGMIGMGASLKLLTAQPTAQVRQAILATSDYACERLASVGAKVVSHRDALPNGHDPRTGIVAFELPGQDPVEARSRCMDAGVVLSCRGGRLRIAIHAYNNEQDIDRLIDVLGASS
ncbi:Cysteine desulfurase [Posidoniimonas polymericola]|uniref:Cysteine desulfurase n=1 Tax=Posidoniimonas polymericola TaxID=2528002 RepID=A0A5C5YRA9_9BACT|nr:aminotransferase class V-fold PLP-dependent enzyme [Posidoniimonas polymericola]TWT77415.1 Cysteine desulfurase [Posidoniimonas polymericola]